ILPGINWAREIDTHLNTAQLILLLISSDFMFSDYCYGVEMQRALSRHAIAEAWVLPIILRPVFWEVSPIADLEVLPTDGIPVTEWANRDKAFDDVVRGIYRVVKVLRETLDRSSKKVPELTHDAPSKDGKQTLVFSDESSKIDPVITPGRVQDSFEYLWPTLPPEKFSSGRWYQVSVAQRNVRLLLAWTEREAWGKLRGRAVIFAGGHTENIKTLKPWTEFAETDDGEYACRIPDPQ